MSEVFGIAVRNLNGNGALDAVRVYRVAPTPQSAEYNVIGAWVG